MKKPYVIQTRHLIGAVVLAVLVVGGLWTAVTYANQRPTPNKLRVAASFYPLFAIAQQVGGNLVEVDNITPAGEEPHDYQPTPQQLVQLQQSDILIYNGATFEPWVQSFLKDYSHQAVAASQGIDLLPAYDTGRSSATDPHFWLDPVLAQQMTKTIRDAFITADPEHADRYQQQAGKYISRLQQLDQQFSQGLAHCRVHQVISSHEALRYVAKRYNFNVTSIAGISPDEEPSPAKLAELSKIMRQKRLNTVLFETLVSPRLAGTLAQEVGATTAVFDPVEGLTEQEQAAGQDYISIQQKNLQVLRKAMSCQ